MDVCQLTARHLPRFILLLALSVGAGPLMAADEVILLPDDDGTVGTVFFSSGDYDTELDEERERVRLYGPLLRLTSTASQGEVDETYGGILSILLGPDNPMDTLPEIVNLTLGTHPLTMQMVHERQVRDALTDETMEGFRPRINLRGDIGEEWTRDPFTRQFEDGFVQLTRREIELGVRQTLFDGWATFSDFDRRQAEADASAYQYQALAERVAAQVSDVYLNLLRDNDLLELAKKNLQIHEDYVDRIGARSDSGVGRESDLDQAQARLANAQSNVIKTEKRLQDALVRYISLVGHPPLEVLIRPSPTKDDLPATVDEAVDYAVSNHPSVISTLADAEAAHQQLRNARSLYWPRIELGAFARYGDDLDGVKGYNQDFRVMLFFNYNLYNGHADRAKIQRSVYNIEQARTLREDSAREVTEAVRQAWNTIEATEKRLASLERHVESVTKARDSYGEQWRLGDRTLLDVLDAENELYTTQQTLIEARRDYQTALYRLRASMGTLVAHFDAEMPSEADPSREYSAAR